MTDPVVPESGTVEPDPAWWRPLVKPVILVIVSIAAGYIIVGFVGAVDWGAVAAAIGHLSWWQFFPLVAALLLRQVLNAVPLSLFVPGVTLSRSIQNDLAANLIGTISPPPGDVVIRVAMFTSWKVSVLDGMAGVTLNSLTFYSVRFLMPSIGLIFLAIAGAETGRVGLAVLLLLLSAAIVAGLLLVLAQERWAVFLGRFAAQVAQRLRRQADPDEWSQAVADFRSRTSAGLPTKLAKSLAALTLMVLADGAILALALRFTGVGADQVSLLVIAGSFCTAYPLTLMPLFGFGILDAALLAAYTEAAGLEFEPAIVAALAIWRAVTLLGSLALGALVTLGWRRRAKAG